MSKILSITSGKNTPSSRYRIRQHISGLKNKDIFVTDACPFIDKNSSVPLLRKYSPKYYLPIYGLWQSIKVAQRIPSVIRSYSYDKVWLNRELLTGYYTLEPLLNSNIILDVDDAIWLNPPFGKSTSARLANRSNTIICGNSYLADWFSNYNNNCVVIPTSVDTDYLTPKTSYRKEFLNIGWIGTHGNLKYLYEIINPILKVLDKYSYVQLIVISDVEPEYVNLHDRINFKYWSPREEQANFQSIDIGLMPLPNTTWANGKCSYKLLQHMSCSVPVVGSPVGMNQSILKEEYGALSASSLEDWFVILDELIKNQELRSKLGVKARKFVVNNYSNEIVQSKLAEVLK